LALSEGKKHNQASSRKRRYSINKERMGISQMIFWPGTTIEKSTGNCFSDWKERQEWSQNWSRVNQAANISRNSTATVETNRAKGNMNGTFHGISKKADLLIKQFHGGAYTKAKK
jgi:hypothetical protein